MIETQGTACLQPRSPVRTTMWAILFIATSSILLVHASTASAASIVTEWLDEALPDAQDVAWEPTIGARFLAILYTAMYDAWTAYDPVAIGFVSGTTFKNKGGADNEANKREAISYAAYTVLYTLAPPHRRSLAERMQALGFDPNADTAPARIGRRAAVGVLSMRREDGSNEPHDFVDTTGYSPRNPAAPDTWQPTEDFGKRQLPMTPHWGRVLPFALTRADQFRPAPPPAPGTPEWTRQIEVLISTSGALTDLQKAEAEYWGIWGMAPPPQLFEITKFVSNTNDLRLDDDVKLFFVVANAILDASIATWDSKYVYDYIRPITAIRALGDTTIKTWRPRSLPTALAYSTPSTQQSAASDSGIIPAGTGEIRAADWEPYLPTPPFPSYVSGHSAFTAAWARVMELAMGRPDLNFRKTVRRLYVEQRELAQPVTLDYPTFASAAEASGMSRIWAGVHWPADNDEGQKLGRQVGEVVWQRAQEFILGTASPAAAVFAALHPPHWYYENETTARPAHFQTADGLAIDLPAGAAGAWRSIAVDPMPAGSYELRLGVAVTGDQAIQLNASVQTSEQSSAVVLGSTDAVVAAASPSSVVTVPWQSDGTQPFTVSIEARSKTGSGRVLISAINATRIWPVVAGSPRYYEPSSAGH
jgi:membrane-associated phospholipid phosphatase